MTTLLGPATTPMTTAELRGAHVMDSDEYLPIEGAVGAKRKLIDYRKYSARAAGLRGCGADRTAARKLKRRSNQSG